MISGKVTIHKSDAVTRSCKAVSESSSGSLYVWDTLPDNWEWVIKDGTPLVYEQPDDPLEKSGYVEPDIIAPSDKFERVERDESWWKESGTKAVLDKAEERDDVDEDKVKKNL